MAAQATEKLMRVHVCTRPVVASSFPMVAMIPGWLSLVMHTRKLVQQAGTNCAFLSLTALHIWAAWSTGRDPRRLVGGAGYSGHHIIPLKSSPQSFEEKDIQEPCRYLSLLKITQPSVSGP